MSAGTRTAGTERKGVPLASPRARFEELLARRHGIAFKVAAAYCRDPEDRRDLAQEIRAPLWRAFPGFDPERRFSTWMYRIALNVAISHRRERRLAGARRRLDEIARFEQG